MIDNSLVFIISNLQNENELCIQGPSQHTKCMRKLTILFSFILIVYIILIVQFFSIIYRILTMTILTVYQHKNPKDETAYYEEWLCFGLYTYHYNWFSATLY